LAHNFPFGQEGFCSFGRMSFFCSGSASLSRSIRRANLTTSESLRAKWHLRLIFSLTPGFCLTQGRGEMIQLTAFALTWIALLFAAFLTMIITY